MAKKNEPGYTIITIAYLTSSLSLFTMCPHPYKCGVWVCNTSVGVLFSDTMPLMYKHQWRHKLDRTKVRLFYLTNNWDTKWWWSRLDNWVDMFLRCRHPFCPVGNLVASGKKDAQIRREAGSNNSAQSVPLLFLGIHASSLIRRYSTAL